MKVYMTYEVFKKFIEVVDIETIGEMPVDTIRPDYGVGRIRGTEIWIIVGGDGKET